MKFGQPGWLGMDVHAMLVEKGRIIGRIVELERRYLGLGGSVSAAHNLAVNFANIY